MQTDRSAIPAAGPMNPIVQPPHETVEQLLHIQPIGGVAKSAEDDFFLISDTIAICIFEIKNIRRRSDKNSPIPADHCRRPGQVVGVDCRFIEFPIAVGVGEHANPPQLFLAPLRIVAHLNDEQVPVFIKRHGHRIDHEWLGRGQLDLESLLHRECLERIGRLHRRHPRQIFRIDHRLGPEHQEKKEVNELPHWFEL